MRRAAARFCCRSDRGVGECIAGVGGTLGSLEWAIDDIIVGGLVVGTLGSRAGLLVFVTGDAPGIGGGLKSAARWMS